MSFYLQEYQPEIYRPRYRFVVECLEADLFDPSFPKDDLFLTTKRKLKTKVLEYGANAVINCHFEYQQKRDGKYFLELLLMEQ